MALYHPTGCHDCAGTGYQGRTGIYELIAIDNRLRKRIHNRSSEALIEVHARQMLMSMQEDGFRRVLSGNYIGRNIASNG